MAMKLAHAGVVIFVVVIAGVSAVVQGDRYYADGGIVPTRWSSQASGIL